MPSRPPDLLSNPAIRPDLHGHGSRKDTAAADCPPTLQASCRPHSWSLYGVHTGPLGGSCWQEPQIEAAVRTARALGGELGMARLWLWCPAGLPEAGSRTLLAGHAALLGLGLRALGLEISTQALWRLDDEEVATLKDLRRAGLDVALRLMPADFARLASNVERAHALQLTVIAGEVATRTQALELGERGVSAVLGPIVCPAMALEPMRRFLGPREPWLERMRAESA